jgi:hypothetical protein
MAYPIIQSIEGNKKPKVQERDVQAWSVSLYPWATGDSTLSTKGITQQGAGPLVAASKVLTGRKGEYPLHRRSRKGLASKQRGQ